MAIIKQDYGTIIDPSTFFDNLTTATQPTTSSTISYTFIVGKTYFIKYNRGGTQTELGIQSGATVISEGTAITRYSSSNVNEYFGIIKATSTTIVLYGNNNTITISQLD